MSGPIGQTAPRNDAYGGGTLTPAANPTAVGGSFGGPGASGFPNPGQPPILSARNNSGSNVRIPYARLVPMRPRATGIQTAPYSVAGEDGSVSYAAIPDISLRNNGTLNGRPLQNEYDGLESGELAWILGRRFVPTAFSSEDGPSASDRLASMGASAHQMGMGSGVDRMQRLAYQGWMEAFYRGNFGTKSIVLDELIMTLQVNKYLVKDIATYEPFLAGATVLGSVDLPHVLNNYFARTTAPDGSSVESGKQLYYTKYTPPTKEQLQADPNAQGVKERVAPGDGAKRGQGRAAGLASGLFVMEKGPFLRGKIVNDDAVEMVDPTLKTVNAQRPIFHTVSRNMGDELAFEALYAHMRSNGFFDWTPDGMVLSKLESPSGEPMSSAELDARQAQLFNVCMQGPAIAKTWTGDPKMQCMPMDKVFICVVADVNTVLGGGTAGIGDGAELGELWGAYQEWVAPADGSEGRQADGWEAVQAKITKGGDSVEVKEAGSYEKAVKEYFKQAAVASAGGAGAKDAVEAFNEEKKKMQEHFSPIDAAAWETNADQLRRGAKGATRSAMTNFRLMRCTSSYFHQYSSVKFNETGDGKMEVDPNSRCGLPLGQNNDDANNVTASYIIGAWCIGTVLDNAASRSTVGHLVRIAPASMAINVNVNIEWWSGDKLYRNYMDVNGEVQRRGEFTKAGQPSAARAAGLDLSLADLEEALPWVPYGKKDPEAEEEEEEVV